jgi:hypothetical protein
MKLLLKRTESKGLLGGLKKCTVTAKLEMNEEERRVYDYYGLSVALLYRSDDESDMKQFNTNRNKHVEQLLRLMAKRTKLEIVANDLVIGKVFEDDSVLAIIQMQNIVIEAANVFDAAIKSAATFLGEAALDLPVV